MFDTFAYRQAMQRPFVAILILCLGGCGSKNADPHMLLDLQPGMALSEVHQRLGAGSPHQATATVVGEQIVIEGQLFCPRGVLYLVYRDQKLEKLIDAPARPSTLVPYELGGWITKSLPFDPEQRLASVLAAPALTRDDIQSLIVGSQLAEERRQCGMEPCNILPAVIITAPLWIPTLPIALAMTPFANAAQKKVAQRPWIIQLGMRAQQVDSMLGAPLRVIDQEDDRQIRIYGKKAEFDSPRDYAPSLIAVVLQSDQVVRVFSHDFFNPGLCTAGEIHP